MKLITRIELTLIEEAVISSELPPWLDGYESGKHNPEPRIIGTFLTEHGFAWKRRYVPVFVYRDHDDVDQAGAAIKAFGHPFLLRNETVLPDLELVCCEDIQNAVLNNRPLSYFTDLRNLSPGQILRALSAARDRAERYAEARLHRPLRIRDVERAL